MTNPTTPNQGYALPVETQNLKAYRPLLEQNFIDIDQEIAALMLAVANKATLAQLQALIGGFELLANKNAPGGYAGLDSNARISPSLLPTTITLQASVDFGAAGALTSSGDFILTGAEIGDKVLISASLDMPSGLSADELEMDMVAAAANVTGPDSVRVTAASCGAPISGIRNFNLILIKGAS